MRGAHLITFKNMMQSNSYFAKLNDSQREALLAEVALGWGKGTLNYRLKNNPKKWKIRVA